MISSIIDDTVAIVTELAINNFDKRALRFSPDFSTIAVARVEQNVAWASSLVNYFEQKASAGTALAFTSDLSVRTVSSTNVYVTGVTFNAENVGTQNIRDFTLTLQEA